MIKIDPNALVDPKFIGIPYKLSGKSFEGADCIGAALLWLEDQGVKYEYDDGLGPVMKHWWQTHPRRFLDAFLAQGINVHWPDIKKYDCLLFFGAEQSSLPSCLGIMVDDRHFMIASEERGTFIDILSIEWKRKFWGSIRLHKVVEKFGS